MEKKQKWGEGPWLNEPDEDSFEHLGLQCRVARAHAGNWCGYVELPSKTHPWFGCDETTAVLKAVPVHGTLSYAAPTTHALSPCFRVETWEIGFDCGHLFDVVPGKLSAVAQIRNAAEEVLIERGEDFFIPQGEAKYRTFDYVQAETRRLAHKVREIEWKTQAENNEWTCHFCRDERNITGHAVTFDQHMRAHTSWHKVWEAIKYAP